MTQETHYITTAIPYVNAAPHLGFAFETLLADALARYHRLTGRDVRFQSGSDENSLKNVRAAEQEGITTEKLVARNAELFRRLREALGLSWDDFIRTSSDPRHRPGVHALWRACQRSGDIDRRAYSGLYCVGCEQFYTEAELADGRCPEHGTTPDRVEEENYFFRLSRYQDRLLELIESGELRIEPIRYRNEVTGFIRSGLRDFSISRSRARARGWGIPVPGDPEQVIYVWFDALGNYVTALDSAEEGDLFARYWCGSRERCHVIGKGITRFHAVYWPAILLSAGLPLPTALFVHGYVTVEGEKISKSAGSSPDPTALAAELGVDSLRYYLLRHLRAGQDGDFSRRALLRAHNDELADQLGNLLSRSLGLLHRYADGIVPEPAEPTQADGPLIETAESLRPRVARAFADFRLHEGLASIWQLVEAANRYVEQTAPWKLARLAHREDARAAERLATVLYNLIEALRVIALHCAPFLPLTAERLAQQLGFRLDDGRAWCERTRWGGYPPGRRVTDGEAVVLFAKHPL